MTLSFCLSSLSAELRNLLISLFNPLTLASGQGSGFWSRIHSKTSQPFAFGFVSIYFNTWSLRHWKTLTVLGLLSQLGIFCLGATDCLVRLINLLSWPTVASGHGLGVSLWSQFLTATPSYPLCIGIFVKIILNLFSPLFERREPCRFFIVLFIVQHFKTSDQLI